MKRAYSYIYYVIGSLKSLNFYRQNNLPTVTHFAISNALPQILFKVYRFIRDIYIITSGWIL
jgi:hypothetical protein